MTHLGMTKKQLDQLKQHPILEEFVESFEALVVKRRDMIWKVRDVKENAKKRKATSLVPKTLGALGAVGGAFLIFTPLAPIGVGMALLGTVTVAGTQVICNLTDTDKKEVLNILKEDWKEVDICQEKLTRFSKCANELTQHYSFDYKTAASLLTSYLFGFGVDLFPSAVREGSRFVGALARAVKCPLFHKKCMESVAVTGVKSTFTKICIPVSALVDVVTVGIEWGVDKKVDKIDELIESLQGSINRISKLIFELSEDFRKNES